MEEYARDEKSNLDRSSPERRREISGKLLFGIELAVDKLAFGLLRHFCNLLQEMLKKYESEHPGFVLPTVKTLITKNDRHILEKYDVILTLLRSE